MKKSPSSWRIEQVRTGAPPLMFHFELIEVRHRTWRQWWNGMPRDRYMGSFETQPQAVAAMKRLLEYPIVETRETFNAKGCEEIDW